MPWEGLNEAIGPLLREALQRRRRDPGQATGLIRGLESIVQLMGPQFQSRRHPKLGSLAGALLDAMADFPAGTREELATTRTVLTRLVLLTGYTPQGGRPADKDLRRQAFREMVLSALEDAALPAGPSKLPAQVLREVERAAFGDCPVTIDAARDVIKRTKRKRLARP